jgi:hypothetical protein
MRKEIGVLLMEDESGEVAVQLFSDVKGSEVAFKDLKGSPADPKRRATLISLRYGGDGTVSVLSMVKELPLFESVEGRPDGYMIGEGPVHFPKE